MVKLQRAGGTVLSWLLILILALALLGGVVFCWISAMALLPPAWQLPATLFLALILLSAVLSILEVFKKA